jgi:NTE family protein
MTAEPAKLALVLAGGGARAAYQVGFLRSLARAFPDLRFPILTGVSAGAINAAFLANSTEDFPRAVERLTELWTSLTVDQVFRTNFSALGANMLRWIARLTTGGVRLTPATRGLVDTAPLRHFLHDAFGADGGPLTGIDANIRRGRLFAVGITTTSYATGQSNTWVQGDGLSMWERPGRRSRPAILTVEHVIASCALPLFFPAAQLENTWHGDGGLGMTAPLSPALHLGADRMIAISTRYARNQTEADEPTTLGYPPPATVLGVLLDTVFLDTLDYDAMNIRRINQLLREHPGIGNARGLRPVELLLQRPSQNLESLAHEFEADLPRSFRFATRGLGTRQTSRADLLATLLFEPGYIKRMIEIGERDGDLRREEIARFLGR